LRFWFIQTDTQDYGARTNPIQQAGTDVAFDPESPKEANVNQTQTREIPRTEWNDFFSRFSDQHDDEPVEVQMMGADIGAQIEGRELRLRGISPAQNVRESDLALELDSIDGKHVTHMIPKPTHVWLQQALDKTDEALEIESADGTKTLVRFSTADAETPPRAERFPRKGDDEDVAE
jgi:hypothetical protein